VTVVNFGRILAASANSLINLYSLNVISQLLLLILLGLGRIRVYVALGTEGCRALGFKSSRRHQ